MVMGGANEKKERFRRLFNELFGGKKKSHELNRKIQSN